ncbi:hypothetical protein SAMN05444274_10426 [Mariniphaga anaerophila]|uniref:DUF1349 domain-containing protein n=1 Tax=Mariniphaga anaerophila TaxID=1484053 RepID=A0A1M4ZQL2_9BACT|nr:DUF1349 domain-containing protein [Mariniphaga anaerophila]SHF20215.1 hypothetical protein SAMN05444274_10426 [Mariniphaga anaerophila]
MNPDHFYWINPPRKYELNEGILTVQTDSETDFWQRTYYEFSNSNAPAWLTKITGDFTFSVKTAFNTRNRYDQCGVLLYIDDENWVKVSIEHENEQFARLGSVVTNLGFSDWATTDIPFPVHKMNYRLSLRGQDILVENAAQSEAFRQMRIAHLHKSVQNAGVGIYACSPLDSSFEAAFSNFKMGPCAWVEH